MDSVKSFFADYNCFTTAEGLLSSGMADVTVTYDMFFREIPDNGGFAIMAGLEQLISHLSSLSFPDE